MTDGPASSPRPPEQWRLRRPIGPREIGVAILGMALLGLSARHTDLDRMAALVAQYGEYLVGLRGDSEVAKGIDRYVKGAFPPVLSDAMPVDRIPGFDRAHLPVFSHLEVRQETSAAYDEGTGAMVSKIESHEVLVRPLGYLAFVLGKMVESLELALWGTLLGIGLGAPVAYFGTRGYTPHPVLHAVARAFAAFLRAVPELVSALLLVLAFGFGPIPCVLAFALHSAGFLGKFYADDVENADRGPQEALFSLGANPLKVLRFAVLPQVLPQYASYTQYVLERNVRMATVIGIVGGGGIGTELKGRYDMFEFGHVTTIVIVIVLTVIALEQLAQWTRRRLM